MRAEAIFPAPSVASTASIPRNTEQATLCGQAPVPGAHPSDAAETDAVIGAHRARLGPIDIQE